MKLKTLLNVLKNYNENYDINFTYVCKDYDYISDKLELEVDLDTKVISLVINDGCEREL